MTAGRVELPAELRRTLGDLPAEARARVTELHGKFQFTDDQVDCFEANHGSVNAENLTEFQVFLEREHANVAKQVAKPGRATSQGAPGAKRPRGFMMGATMNLPSAVEAALGRIPRASVLRGHTAANDIMDLDAETATPVKRAREVDGPEGGTPEASRKQLQVSVKSSVNDMLDVKRQGAPGPAPSLELLGDPKLWKGSRHEAYAWMDEPLDERAAERDRRLAGMELELVAAMRAKHGGLEDAAHGVVGVPLQSEAILCGRLLCEGLEGKMNERSMLLEGPRGAAKGARVQLNVAACPALVAFPGQFVAVLGRSGMGGTTFHARDFIPGLPLAPPASVAAPERFHMLILAGPFCMRDSLDYSPLERALEHAARASPQVLLILGPLVDAGNRRVSEGEAVLPDEEEPCSFEDLYMGRVLPVLKTGIRDLKRASPSTEVLLVPSIEEVLCFHPLPQPPLDASLGPALGQRGPGVLRSLGARLLPNPAHLDIDGLRVSVTSADALTPVMRAGFVLRPDEKKIEQALRLLLLQRTLFPVAPRDPPQVSEARAAALDFPELSPPDICIFPSAMGNASATFVDGRLFVNPGSLCRPAALGTFAELWLVPPQAWSTSLEQRTRVDIQSLG